MENTLMLLLLMFAALLGITQLVPALIMFTGMVKGLFAKSTIHEMTKTN